MARDDSAEYAARSYYRGDVAAGYRAHRLSTPEAARKWDRERVALEQLLDGLAVGTIIDVPCGDGRFAGLLDSRGYTVVGADISRDMLRIGRQRGDLGSQTAGLLETDAEALPLRDGACDHAVTARFFNLVPLEVVKSVLDELRRVTSGSAVVEVRLAPSRWVSSLAGLRRALRARAVRSERAERSELHRDPLRIHGERAFREVVERAGWRISGRAEVRTSSRRFHASSLWFLRLDRAP